MVRDSVPRPPGGASFDFAVRVYYEDTDAAGVVYYANYLRFCERARTEWLRALGYAQQRLAEEEATAFVVTSVSADYRRPARLDDELLVRSHLATVRGASLVFAQNIYRKEELIFESRITVACMNTLRMRAAPLPAALRTQLLSCPQS